MLSWQLFNFFCIVFVTLEVTLKDTSFIPSEGVLLRLSRASSATLTGWYCEDGYGSEVVGSEG
jgi:hypothetical protein